LRRPATPASAAAADFDQQHRAVRHHHRSFRKGLGLFAAGAAGAEDAIKIGTIFPLSGGAGPNGQAVTNAVKLIADQLNQKGGVLGRKLVIVSKDDESTPAVGVTRANELVGEKVSLVIEGWNSPVTLAEQPVLARADILDITAVSKADPIVNGDGNPYAIRINSSNRLDGAVIAKYLKTTRAKRIAFLTQNDTYGNGAQGVIEEELRKIGVISEVVATERFPFKQTDFRVAMTNIAQANPDAVVAINASEASGMPALIEQYRQADIKAALIAAVGTILPTVLKVAGPANNGIVSADIYFANLPPFANIPANVAFVQAFHQAYGEDPDKGAALGAEALSVWARAAEATKSLDRKTVAAAIRGQTVTDTLFGDATFAANGQLEPRYVLIRVVDAATGKLEVLP
jgi:branched-chain amino acid transport system substrate-binding protein